MIVAIFTNSERFIFEESIGSSNEMVSILQSNNFNSGMFCNNSLKLKAFKGSPQKSGTCIKVFTGTPKKPNSALRKLTKIVLTKGKTLIAQIPGEGHNLQKFSTVLCRGSRVRDTPGIKYRVIRGVKKYHLKGILARVRGRSKYGTKKFSKKI